MTLTLHLPPETAAWLRARAAARGQDVAAYLQQLIEEDRRTEPPLKEILAPLRKDVEESGVTDEELDALVEEIREEIWQEKQAGKGQ